MYVFKWIVLLVWAGLSLPAVAQETRQAIFAGGCFWCMEPPFDKLPGVISTTSGYIGGHVANPTYKQVTRGRTGHTEAVKVVYDPQVVSYETLLQVFWRNIDPVDKRGQFCDKGSQYRPGIFYRDEQQRAAAQSSKDALVASGRFTQELATEITEAGVFYIAEEYHQDYYQKNPLRYKFYRSRCGRDQRLAELWGPSVQLPKQRR
ncbi:peptide-methionine (S)-S-oxide reductase MsrA [Exilibacterium tricleocarpae]|uniref:Peptide methionine sulfoxide reductase MsrA n=1 Tax=Exilibacterium tricleocarpae TaxID=2591008 RepID=A0A545STH8_9GAMM|nr:peptide-methionine (S)-S-oxide reductase MsrA [Exilibacterium tricleocarpae]TQV68277.1 peptide-methionine (S)-S-oxide reductase MsrA [Exilibacterium tricleocarpae]